MKKIPKFKHLTELDRAKIEALSKEGYGICNIAGIIGVNKSTISREISNRGTPSGYHAWIAELNYKKKRSVCHPKNKIEDTKIGTYIIGKIKEGWSPEQISGRIKKEIDDGERPPSDSIVAETIYQFVYDSEYGQREKFYQYLRRGKKRRTKKFGRKSQKEIIKNRVFIDERPAEVNLRNTVGHWESDSIIYPHKEALNSLLERKSRYAIVTKLKRKTAELTRAAITDRLKDQICLTLTVDNGTENKEHKEIAHDLAAQVYFCHAFHSWEKGSNENFNGLIRRYLPRGESIQEVTQEEIDDIAWELNNRPRKILGFKTPAEVLKSEYQKLVIVAFGSGM